MGKKSKYTVEFNIRASPTILYNYLATPSGLSQWFSDDVDIREKSSFIFKWGSQEQTAKLLKSINNKLVRYKWDDMDEDEYFEIEIQQDELTGDVALVITDFADATDMDGNKKVWESQVETLKHNIGS